MDQAKIQLDKQLLNLEFQKKNLHIVNQVCGSGIRSVASGFQSIKSGDSKIVIAGGQENMSLAPHAIHLRDGKKLVMQN